MASTRTRPFSITRRLRRFDDSKKQDISVLLQEANVASNPEEELLLQGLYCIASTHENGLRLSYLRTRYSLRFHEELPSDAIVEQLIQIASKKGLLKMEKDISGADVIYPALKSICANFSIAPGRTPVIGGNVKVMVTHLVDSTNEGIFYVQSESTCIQELTNEIQICAESAAPLATVNIGWPVLAKCSDGVWNRASILRHHHKNGQHLVEVKFTDFGNIEHLVQENLRQMPTVLATKPAQAIRCKLEGIAVADNFYDFFWRASNNLEMLFTMTIVSKTPEMALVSLKSDSGGFMAEQLVQAGVAYRLLVAEPHPVPLPINSVVACTLVQIDSEQRSVNVRLNDRDESSALIRNLMLRLFGEGQPQDSTEPPIVDNVYGLWAERVSRNPLEERLLNRQRRFSAVSGGLVNPQGLVDTRRRHSSGGGGGGGTRGCTYERVRVVGVDQAAGLATVDLLDQAVQQTVPVKNLVSLHQQPQLNSKPYAGLFRVMVANAVANTCSLEQFEDTLTPYVGNQVELFFGSEGASGKLAHILVNKQKLVF